MRYTLEWIYQFVIFESEQHFLFRQCASALIALLGAQNSINVSFEKLPLCFSKWFMAAAKFSSLEVCLDRRKSYFIRSFYFSPRFFSVAALSNFSTCHMFECNKYSRTVWRVPSDLFRQILGFHHVYGNVSVAIVSIFGFLKIIANKIIDRQ